MFRAVPQCSAQEVYDMGYGLIIKTELHNRNMTIKELSKITGISINTLYSITKRDSNRIDSLVFQKINSVLDITNSKHGEDKNMKVGEKIKKARKENCLTMREMANLVGVSYQMICQWESGERNPKLENIVKMSSVFKINPMELLPDWFIEEVNRYATP